jgi:hypothetical protein
MSINGTDIYIAAIDPSTKLPIGVFHCMYLNSLNRFRLPLYTEGTSLGGEVPISARWTMIGPSGVVPALSIIEVTERWGADPDNTREAFYTSATTLCGYTKSRVVIAATAVRDRNMKTSTLMTHFTPMAVEQTFSVEMCVQFVYADGTHSRLSNAAAFSVTTSYANQCIGIATTVAVSSSISQTVASVNVFRRIVKRDESVTPELDWELLYTADVSTDIIAEKDRVSSESSINKYWSSLSDIDASCDGITSFGKKDTGFNTVVFPDAGSRRSFVGLCAYTSGWFKCGTYTPDAPDSYLMVYCPNTLIAKGVHTVWAGQIHESHNEDTDGWYYKRVVGSSTPNEAVIAYGWESLLGSNTYCLGADESVLSPEVQNQPTYLMFPIRRYIGAVDNWVSGSLSLSEQTQHRAFGAELAGTAIFVPTASSVKTNYLAEGPTTASGSTMTGPRVMFMFVDNSQAGFSVESVCGVKDEERSTVYPRKIAFVGGRMIGLNVVQDGKELSSRLSYSEFRRLNAFRESSYIDYDTRDDGSGVAIASFAGRILVLHTTSSYILDISGGSDMSWRELGAYGDVGAISDLAVVSTNVGIFFGSYSDVYWFDGTKLVKITELEGRRVSTAYRAMDKSKVSLVWRGDLRQLWVCERLSNILVFDMDRGAWHRHALSEISNGEHTTPIRFNNVANVEFLTAQYKLLTVDAFYAFRFNPNVPTSCPFQWGLTTGLINMGASEIIKKSKSFYLDLSGVTTQPAEPWYLPAPNERIPWGLDIWYTDVTGSVDKFIVPPTGRLVQRIRTSVRRSWLNFKVLAKLNGSTYWRGSIESLGLSYKPKRLK